MQHSMSIWTLKKQPLADVARYITDNGSLPFQARMASLAPEEYAGLSTEARQDRLIRAIASMEDETYSDFLLELIDE